MRNNDDLEYPIDADDLDDVIELLFDLTLIATGDGVVRDRIYSDLQKLPSSDIGPFSVTFLNNFTSSDPEQGSGSDWVAIDAGDDGMEFSIGNSCLTPGVGGDTLTDTIFTCWDDGRSEGNLADWLAKLKALDRETMRMCVSHEYAENDNNHDENTNLADHSSSLPIQQWIQFRPLTADERNKLANFDDKAATDTHLPSDRHAISGGQDTMPVDGKQMEDRDIRGRIAFDPNLSSQVGQMMTIYFEDGPATFADVAFDLAADLDLSLLELKPYLRCWYEGIRCWRQDAGEPVDGMDSPEAVHGAISMIRGR